MVLDILPEGSKNMNLSIEEIRKAQSIDQVTLVNFAQRRTVKSLADGEILYLNNNNLSDLVIRADIFYNGEEANPPINVVRFYVNEASPQIQGVFPYTFRGDRFQEATGGNISPGTYSVNIRAYAAGGILCDQQTIRLELDTFDCTNPAVSIPQYECESIVDVYYALGGWQWIVNSGWLENYNICEWYGITCTGSIYGSQDSTIELPNNSLFGAIPETIQVFSAVKGIDMSNNYITGPLPDGISDMNILEWLDLSKNQIDGEIPTSWDSMYGRINDLRLENNALTGEVPRFDTLLPDGATLDIGYNALEKNSNDTANQMSVRFPGWDQAQTVAPKNISVGVDGTTGDVQLSWSPISYTNPDHGGFYRVYYATDPTIPIAILARRLSLFRRVVAMGMIAAR